MNRSSKEWVVRRVRGGGCTAGRISQRIWWKEQCPNAAVCALRALSAAWGCRLGLHLGLSAGIPA